jgi:hypothetical protein
MIKKQQIETQLDCRATANLRSEIVEDLSKPDKPIKDLIMETEKETDESKNINEQGC